MLSLKDNEYVEKKKWKLDGNSITIYTWNFFKNWSLHDVVVSHIENRKSAIEAD